MLIKDLPQKELEIHSKIPRYNLGDQHRDSSGKPWVYAKCVDGVPIFSEPKE